MVNRFAFWLSPAGVLIGYLLALLAAKAGVAAFPFVAVGGFSVMDNLLRI
jgi:hypothetical protein